MDQLALSVHFECLSEKTTIIREVKLPPVTSVLQIKQYLEDKHNVPVSMQTLRHRSVVLNEDTSVRSLRLRAGDELHVSYYAAAECEEVRSVIKRLDSLDKFCEFEENDTIPQYMDDRVLEFLSFDMFFPWVSPVKRANKQFFIANGGLSVLMELYRITLRHTWVKLPLELKVFELDLLSALWNLSETIPFRHAILKEDGLAMCMKSLVRVEVDGSNQLVVPNLGDDEEDHMITCRLISNTIQRAIGVLTCLCEIPSCHTEVATNMAAMKQFSRVILCPLFDAETIRNSAILCLTLGYSEATHRYLVEAGLVDTLTSHTQLRIGQNEMEDVLTQYHVAVFLTQLVLESHCYLTDRLFKINEFLTKFVDEAVVSKLADYEIKWGYLWATFLPYIKLIYQPNTPCCEELLLSETQDMALQTSIIALHSMLDRSIHREVLVREGLVDYLTCMPWYTTGLAQQRSRALVRMVQQSPDVDLQPPSLLNMTKACVAKNYCGLQTVVHLSVPDIIQSIVT